MVKTMVPYVLSHFKTFPCGHARANFSRGVTGRFVRKCKVCKRKYVVTVSQSERFPSVLRADWEEMP